MNIQAFAASDRGRRRESNEDHYLIDESLGLYVVCDGMGGHAAGEVAAERSVALAAEYIRDHRDILDSAGDSPDGYFRVLELAEDATQEASHRLDKLKSTFLCRNFSVSRLTRVLNIASIVECAAGQRLLSSSQPCDGLYVVLDGRLTVEDDSGLSGELRPTDCVGESFLLHDGKIETSVVADRPSRLLFIPRSDFGKLIRGLPKLGNALLRNLCQHLSEDLNQLRLHRGTGLSDTAIWERDPG